MSIRSAWVLSGALCALTQAVGLGCKSDVKDVFGGDVGGGGGEGGESSSSSSASVSSSAAGSGGGGGGSLDCVFSSDCASLDGLCLKGACFQGTCVQQPAPDLTPCEDGYFCTVNDFCMGGACSAGGPRDCDQGDPCSTSSCDEVTNSCKKSPGPDGPSCDDNDPCTGAGKCAGGACAPGAPIDCSFKSDECNVGACDPAFGCVGVPANNGASCDPGPADPCTAGECNNGACAKVPAGDGDPCDDGLFCTDNTACAGGVCAGGSTHPCTEPGPCLVGACDAATDKCLFVPTNNGAACDDLDACTTGTTCAGGACAGGAAAPDGISCDDGLSCTAGETCSAGVCGGGGGGSQVYFADSFTGNQKGWLLGKEWEIGPAKASSGGTFGADPSSDHSLSVDNGVAGVVLGGNAERKVHPYRYLESPPFDTTGAGPVIFSFYRWLNSDYDPYMHSDIEVWDGAKWVELWKTGQTEIQDSPPKGSGWTYIEHDITAYRGAATRVRFGFDIGNDQVYNVGSWNIDDVVVAGAPCP